MNDNSKFITLKAAHEYLQQNSNGKRNAIPLEELRELINGNKPKPKSQGWSFVGTHEQWKRAVSKVFHG